MKRNAFTASTRISGKWALLALIGLGSAACSQKDPAQCKEALDAIRSSLEKDDVAKAKEARVAGYKHCKPNVMGSVDRDIVAKETELASQKAETEHKAAETKMLLDLLSQQIAGNRAAAEPTEGDADEKPKITCEAGSDEAMCTSRRKVQGKGYEIERVFIKENPSAFRYRTEPKGEFDCGALGAHTVKREWTHKRRERKHCEFTGGPLNGLQAMTSVGPGEYKVEVFSAEFLEATPKLKDSLEKEGVTKAGAAADSADDGPAPQKAAEKSPDEG
jgi:hypothetical protein